MRKFSQSILELGFTLVELLVVISIISLLSSMVFAALKSARIKSRDARRATDIRQIQFALEFYYDANDSYPVAALWFGKTGNCWGTVTDNYIPGPVRSICPYCRPIPCWEAVMPTIRHMEEYIYTVAMVQIIN